MNDYLEPTDVEIEKAISMLGDLLSILGWVMLEPEEGTDVEGAVIGSPKFIEAWQERVNASKGGLN